MFAPARAFRRLCRSFRASQHRAFARVCDLWRLLVLAPVSTGRRWWITENVRAARPLELPDLELAALPTRQAPGACPPLSDRDPHSPEVAARTGHRTGRRALQLRPGLPS